MPIRTLCNVLPLHSRRWARLQEEQQHVEERGGAAERERRLAIVHQREVRLRRRQPQAQHRRRARRLRHFSGFEHFHTAMQL